MNRCAWCGYEEPLHAMSCPHGDLRSPASTGSAVPIIVDPDYSRFIVQARIMAKQDGYALAVHGTLTRDLDVIAVPWAATCREPHNLVARIEGLLGWKRQAEEPTVREHGRLVWSLIRHEVGDPRFVDFSVIPPNREASPAEPQARSRSNS